MTTDILADLRSFMTEGSAEVVQEQFHHPEKGGKFIVYPKTEDEIAKVLSYANKHRKTVSVIGGGTKRGFGKIEVNDILLSMVDFKGITAHSVENSQITVKAGTPFEAIQQYLEDFDQMIALDPFWPEQATIGGIIAANDSGPKQLGYGKVRDSLLDFRLVYPDGEILQLSDTDPKSGPGTELNKIFIGSMGALGVFTEVTLKLQPLRPNEHLVLYMFYKERIEEIEDLARKISESELQPVAVELLSPALTARMIGHSCYMLAIALEGEENAIQVQERTVRKMKPEQAGLVIFEKERASQFWQAFYQIGPNKKHSEHESFQNAATLKIGMKNVEIPQILQEAERLRKLFDVHMEAHGSLGTGICYMHLQGDSIVELGKMIFLLREKINRLNGYAIINYLTPSLLDTIDVWGELPSFSDLVRRVKDKVDPNRILNPYLFPEKING